MPATDLDYPFDFTCANCEAETTVRRADALSLDHDPGSIEAVLMVLDKHGWLRDEEERLLLCPACAEDA